MEGVRGDGDAVQVQRGSSSGRAGTSLVSSGTAVGASVARPTCVRAESRWIGWPLGPIVAQRVLPSTARAWVSGGERAEPWADATVQVGGVRVRERAPEGVKARGGAGIQQDLIPTPCLHGFLNLEEASGRYQPGTVKSCVKMPGGEDLKSHALVSFPLPRFRAVKTL